MTKASCLDLLNLVSFIAEYTNKHCWDGDVFIQTFILDFKFSLNLPFLLQRKVEGRYIGFSYVMLQELACIYLLVFEAMSNKVSHISTEYIKYMNKFWGKIYSKNCQLFESFKRFQLTFLYHEKSIFLYDSTSSVALIFYHNLQC